VRRWAAGVLALLLAGCGSAKEKPIHIGVAPGLTESFLVFLARELGYFRDEGLDVAFDEFQGAHLIESLVTGSSDAAYVTFRNTFLAAAHGRPVKSFFLGAETLSAMLVVCEKKAAQLRRVENLKGTTIGMAGFGTAQQEYLQYILSRSGFTLADVTLVAYGTGPSAIAALQYGKVDAGIINGSAFAILRRRAPGVRVLVDPRTRQGTRDLTGLDTFPDWALASTAAWLERDPSVARKLTNAMVRTLRWVRAHTAEEVRDRLPVQFRTEDKEADLETLRIIIEGASKDGRMPPGGPEGVRSFVAATNGDVRNTKIDLAATYTNQFVDEVSK